MLVEVNIEVLAPEIISEGQSKQIYEIISRNKSIIETELTLLLASQCPCSSTAPSS